MVFEMIPTFSIDSLDVALCNKFGNAFAEFYGKNLANFLFDNDYYNSSYKSLLLEHIDPEYCRDPVTAQTHNTIIDFLVNLMPENTEYVLIDVSW